MESGVSQIKSSGTKCHKEKMTMSNKAKVGRTHRHASSTKSRKSVVAAGLNTGSGRGPKRQVSSGKGHRVLSDQEQLELDYSIFMTILSDQRSRFYYQPFGDDDAVEIEIEFIDDIQRLQFKVAACRYLKHESDERILASNAITPVVVFKALLSPQDDSVIGVKVIFKPNGPLPAGIESDAILINLDVPSAPEQMLLSKSDIYKLIEEVFTIEGFDRSEYETMFSTTDMPWICSDMCASVYEIFGPITFPPMTLSEFGNVLFSLKYFNAEVALATLHRIYSSRCQA
jgi:hypothetical protein